MIECDQVMDSLLHERVAFFSKHKIIGDTDRDGFGQNDGKHEERVEWPKTTDVEIQIHASIVMENEVTDRVRTLDGIGIGIKRREKPRITC